MIGFRDGKGEEGSVTKTQKLSRYKFMFYGWIFHMGKCKNPGLLGHSSLTGGNEWGQCGIGKKGLNT